MYDSILKHFGRASAPETEARGRVEYGDRGYVTRQLLRPTHDDAGGENRSVLRGNVEDLQQLVRALSGAGVRCQMIRLTRHREFVRPACLSAKTASETGSVSHTANTV